MEAIQQTLKKMQNSSQLFDRLDRLKNEVLNNQAIAAFIQSHPELTDIEKHLSRLFEFKTENENCQTCAGIQSCKNMMAGYEPTLSLQRGAVQVHYRKCEKKIVAEDQARQKKLIKSYSIPAEILSVTFEQIDQDTKSRIQAIAKAIDFAIHAEPGKSGKGLYFYGQFGVGKTYIAGAIANELAQRNISSMLVYTPDFFRELKSGINDGSYNEKLEVVKSVPVLILDDIGAETMSSWVRDDLLGVILQHRMLEKLPTIFTSNYDFDELEEHLSYSQKGGIELLKSKRIMERIRHYAEPVFIEGKNRRFE